MITWRHINVTLDDLAFALHHARSADRGRWAVTFSRRAAKSLVNEAFAGPPWSLSTFIQRVVESDFTRSPDGRRHSLHIA